MLFVRISNKIPNLVMMHSKTTSPDEILTPYDVVLNLRKKIAKSSTARVC